jgi:hypothetical protein
MILTVDTEKDVYWDLEYEDNPIFKEKANTISHEFEETKALACLLLDDVVFINEYWWKTDWPREAKKSFAIAVNTNDCFCYGSDATDVKYHELKDLYDHWIKDPCWGPIVWAAKKENLMPLPRITVSIKESGIWDLSTMNLKENTL